MGPDVVKILGCRGSVPVSGPQFARFGGNTLCIFVRLGGQPLVLDAGTGILSLPSVLEPTERTVPLLLTHGHADHLLGLPLCGCLTEPDFSMTVYAKPRAGLDAGGQVRRLLSPPLWPVGPEALPAALRFAPLTDGLQLGPVTVRTLAGIHPGGVTLLRLDCGGKSVALITDCTLTDDFLPTAAAFAADCDLLLCDGQYTDAEWADRADYGHSTMEAAVTLGRLCRAGSLRLLHHDPTHDDATLGTLSYPFAFDGEEVFL